MIQGWDCWVQHPNNQPPLYHLAMIFGLAIVVSLHVWVLSQGRGRVLSPYPNSLSRYKDWKAINCGWFFLGWLVTQHCQLALMHAFLGLFHTLACLSLPLVKFVLVILLESSWITLLFFLFVFWKWKFWWYGPPQVEKSTVDPWVVDDNSIFWLYQFNVSCKKILFFFYFHWNKI